MGIVLSMRIIGTICIWLFALLTLVGGLGGILLMVRRDSLLLGLCGLICPLLHCKSVRLLLAVMLILVDCLLGLNCAPFLWFPVVFFFLSLPAVPFFLGVTVLFILYSQNSAALIIAHF